MLVPILTIAYDPTTGKVIIQPVGGPAMQSQEAAASLPIESSTFSDKAKEYIAWGASFGGKKGRPWSPDHARAVKDHLATWGLIFATLDEIHPKKVEREMAQMKLQRYAPASMRRRFEAIRGFVTWCLKREYLTKDPLKACVRPNGDPLKRRRAMTVEEIRKLITGDRTPSYRALLYDTAIETCLRLNELRQIPVSHLDVERCGIRLEPEWDKTREERFILLTPELTKQLAAAAEGKKPTDKLLQVPSNMVKCFDKDCLRAGIEKKTVEGVIDFHALRTTGITLIEEAGASDTEVRSLGRHLTSSASQRYRRTRQENLRLLKDKVRANLSGVAPTENTSGSPSSSPAQDVRFSASLADQLKTISEVLAIASAYLSAPDEQRDSARSLLGVQLHCARRCPVDPTLKSKE